MRQLYYVKKRHLEWREVPLPTLLYPSDALVRPIAAARCDLDNAFLLRDMSAALRIGLALHILDPLVRQTIGVPAFEGPFPYGHECVAEVVELGSDVSGFAVGDVVIVPFQLSCGHCFTCKLDLTAHCETDRSTPMRAFGFGKATEDLGGMVTDLLRVPNAAHMLVKVPDGIAPAAVASASDNIADGWRTVASQLRARPGAPVLVLGGRAKSVSLYAAGAAVALGSERVDYLDTNEERLNIAQALGARPIKLDTTYKRIRGSAEFLRGGYPIAVDGSGVAGALDFAIRSLSPGGVCTTVFFYLRAGTPVPLWQMYLYGGTLKTGLANVRADLPDVLQAIKNGKLKPELVTTRQAHWDDAPNALLDPTTKVVLVRDSHVREPERKMPKGLSQSLYPQQ
jgi:threonine dehydrogenase-like Zn-dependent dehydrogenase